MMEIPCFVGKQREEKPSHTESWGGVEMVSLDPPV